MHEAIDEETKKKLFRVNICASLEIKNVYNMGVRVHFSPDECSEHRAHRSNLKFLKFNFCLFEARTHPPTYGTTKCERSKSTRREK